MSFVHCEPNWLDYGVPNSGWRGHGGLSLSDAGNLIPQYSLEAAWKRNILPKCYGFMEGLIPPEKVREDMGLLRPPGQLRFDQRSESLVNRNHLASKIRGDDILLWAVSDRTDRKRIARHSCMKSSNAGCLFTLDNENSNEFIVSDFVNELRPVCSDEPAVWVSTRAGLLYCKEDVATVFTKVAQFEENPYLSGDLAVVDPSGRIWSGTSGQEFSRTKARGEYFKSLTHSDHPKIVFAASDNCVSHVDLRLEVSTPDPIFEIPSFTNYICWKDENRGSGIIRTPTISSIHHVPSHSHCVLIMTDHMLHLVDQRVPRRSLLAISHIVPYGSHVFMPSQPVRDEYGHGSVVSLYALDHCISGLWRTAIYHHDDVMSWSSVVPFSLVGDGSDISKVIQPSSSRCNINPSSNPVRGFSTIEGLQDKKGRYFDVLLRCLDDSSISYQVFRHGEFGVKKRKKMWRASCDRVRKWEQSYSDPTRSYDILMQDCLKTSNQSSTILIDVECSLSPPDPGFAWTSRIHPLRRQIAREPVIIPTLPSPHDQAPLSNLALFVWEKSSQV